MYGKEDAVATTYRSLEIVPGETGYGRKYVWQAPVRLSHWINAFAVGTLFLTGLYIANPALAPNGEAANHFVMGRVREIHFVSGYALLFGFLLRIYCFYFGNNYRSESGAGAQRRGRQPLRDGPRARNSLRVGIRTAVRIPAAYLLLLLRQQLLPFRLPLRVEKGVVGRPQGAGDAVSAFGARPRAPGPQRPGRPGLHVLRDLPGVVPDFHRLRALLGIEPRRFLGPAPGLGDSIAGRLLHGAPVAPHPGLEFRGVHDCPPLHRVLRLPPVSQRSDYFDHLRLQVLSEGRSGS